MSRGQRLGLDRTLFGGNTEGDGQLMRNFVHRVESIGYSAHVEFLHFHFYIIPSVIVKGVKADEDRPF